MKKSIDGLQFLAKLMGQHEEDIERNTAIANTWRGRAEKRMRAEKWTPNPNQGPEEQKDLFDDYIDEHPDDRELIPDEEVAQFNKTEEVITLLEEGIANTYDKFNLPRDLPIKTGAEARLLLKALQNRDLRHAPESVTTDQFRELLGEPSVTDDETGLAEQERKQTAAISVPKPALAPSEPVKPAVGAYPKAYKPGDVFKDCDACPQMVVVPAGTFRMGDLYGVRFNDNEKPVHTVTIARPFAVGKYEVTFGQWDACVEEGGCNDKPPDIDGWEGGRRPVYWVNWGDAKEYVRWLSRKSGKQYRLLSEAE